ncbi:hypothetical protein G9A89_021994 [Geosiphon pyriformis]|nr:hypothetical protein G9A89_021994 [Geosiphon pyriformis]
MNIVHWHVNFGNLVSFVTETKLRSSIKLWIANKFEGVHIFISGLEEGFLSAGVAVEKVPGWVVSVWLLFKGKLSVTVLNLYAGASSSVCFGQTSEVNFIIVKTVNSSTFVVLRGDFNKCGSGRSANFRFCSNLGLVNLFAGHHLVNTPTWSNSRDVEKTIDYIFVSESLSSSVAKHWVGSVSDFFDIDYNAIVVLVNLEELLNNLHKQANKNCWKFKIKDADSIGWSHFRDCSSTKILIVKDRFFATVAEHNLDAMWLLLEKALIDSADEIFSRHWFSVFQCSRNMQSFRFLGLELLVAKIVKKLSSVDILGFDCLTKKWASLDAANALVLEDMDVLKYLSLIKKEYKKSKLYKSKLAQKTSIREAVKKCMEKFCSDKKSIIRSVLNRSFRKVVLDHLVVDNELILEPDEMRLNVDSIMEDYVRNGTFSSVIDAISINELLLVIGSLPDGKATGLSGIPNKLWKHGGEKVLKCLLYALNIASEFFKINDISINIDKTVAICINQGVKVAFLNICGQPISIAKKGKRLSKPSVAKTHSNICFFVNVVLRKTITDKQYSYLVSVILQPIISYQTQFSLKSKTDLPHDFPNAALHHLFLYGLKTFKQVQSERKIAALVFFSNASGIFGCLFNHRFLDLQVLNWDLLDPLQFSVKLHVSPIDNFLAGIAKIFLDNELSLMNNLSNAFHSSGYFLMSSILGNFLYFNSVLSLKRFEVAFGDCLLSKKSGVLDWKIFCHWKRLDFRGPILYWFLIASEFLLAQSSFLPSSTGSGQSGSLNILKSDVFFAVKDGLHDVWSDCFEVYTNGSLKGAGFVDITCGAAAYFLALDLSVRVVVYGLLSSTLAELQAIALFLECVLSSCKLVLHIDSQAVIDSCLSELLSARHSGISGNIKADLAAEEAIRSSFTLLASVCEQFLVAKNTVVSGNAHHFVRDIFWSAGFGYGVVSDELVGSVDWIFTAKVWHTNSHMFAEFTSQSSLNLHTYLIKAVHRHLPVAVWKRLYDKRYPGVLCLLCGEVEFLDHVFTCAQNVAVYNEILAEASAYWVSVAGVCVLSSSAILQALSVCSLDVSLYSVVCKDFVLSEWYKKATVGPSVVIMKKIVEKSGSNGGIKLVLSRKKKKGVALKEAVGGKGVLTKDSETGDTTKSESINMEEKCLVEETSFDYGKSGTIADEEHDQMPKGPSVKTKKALDKPLRKINFSSLDVDNDILLNAPLELPSLLKDLVLVSVRKSFALDIGLDKVVGKSSQEKLISMVLGGAFTPSKFSGIIHASFTSEASLAQIMKKARTTDILVNADLKKSTSHSDRAVVVKKIPVGISAEAVYTVLSKFGIIKSIKMQLQSDLANLVTDEWFILIEKDAVCIARADLDKETWNKRNHHRALLYTLPMRTNAHDIWNFIRCAVVCFNSVESLDAAMRTTLVLRGTNLCWSSLVSARCAKCRKLGHTFLNCAKSKKVSPGGSFYRVLLDADKSRLAAIYAKQSAPVVCPISFNGLSWAKIASGDETLPVVMEINNRFAALECSLTSLIEHVDMLAKKLKTPELMNQEVDIVMSEDLGVAAGSKTIAEAVVFDSFVIGKIENTLKNLAITVMGFSAKMDNAGLDINNPAKQDNIVCWHKDMNNLISIFMETKLKEKIHSWIVKKFEDIVTDDYLGS